MDVHHPSVLLSYISQIMKTMPAGLVRDIAELAADHLRVSVRAASPDIIFLTDIVKQSVM